MEMPKAELRIEKLRENLYMFDEGGMSNCYLLIGSEKACLIDSVNGLNNLAEAAAQITDKPVIVVNTHGHPDHMMGNVFFDKAYMNSKDWALKDMFLQMPEIKNIMDEFKIVFPPCEDIKEGDVIDLGDITLKAIELPGHTPGGIVLLCPEERILFTGDSVNHHLWMQLDHSLSIEETVENLEKVLYLMDEADVLLHGHCKGFDDISLIQYLIDGMKEIIDGKTDGDTDYTYHNNQHALWHPFKVDENKKFENYNSGIVYLKENVMKK